MQVSCLAPIRDSSSNAIQIPCCHQTCRLSVQRESRPALYPKDSGKGAPDLAVEVRSPGDSQREVSEKAKVWLNAGAAAVWVVDPSKRTVAIYSSETADPATLNDTDALTGGSVLPGFRCGVSELFYP